MVSQKSILEDVELGGGCACVSEELLRVLADEGLGVVAGNVVPLDAVLVDVVEDAHTGLHALVDVELGVVRLGDRAALDLGLVAGGRPGLVGPARRGGVGGGHLDSGSRPEPTVHVGGLKVLAVTALEVAEAAGGPDVGEVV